MIFFIIPDRWGNVKARGTPPGKSFAGVLVISSFGVYNGGTTDRKGICFMEESRSFGYLCPHCKKPVLAQRTRFALSAAAVRIECACEKSELRAETDGLRFRLWVPCGLCGETHQAELSNEAMLDGRGVGLACPKTKQLCCYIGQQAQVEQALQELELRAEKDRCQEPEAFTDNVIMYEVLSELKDIAARGGVSCTCGCREYSIAVHRGSVDLICKNCGGKLRLPAATDEDLDRLCCQMKLVIHGV